MMPMMSHASASSRQVQPRHARDTVRWTIHVDRRWRDRVMELSDAERASITDVMDRILRAYFEAGSCT
jgi:hypothetical protein